MKTKLIIKKLLIFIGLMLYASVLILGFLGNIPNLKTFWIFALSGAICLLIAVFINTEDKPKDIKIEEDKEVKQNGTTGDN